MVGYKVAKTAGKTTVSKTGDKYFLIKKRYDPDTGAEQEDSISEHYIDNISRKVTDIETRITALTSEKADYEQLKTDLEAL
tara:strand:+ start:233 stop:475 length:243 start_codon:yes stop_codon:yes gene_type:complete